MYLEARMKHKGPLVHVHSSIEPGRKTRFPLNPRAPARTAILLIGGLVERVDIGLFRKLSGVL